MMSLFDIDAVDRRPVLPDCVGRQLGHAEQRPAGGGIGPTLAFRDFDLERC